MLAFFQGSEDELGMDDMYMYRINQTGISHWQGMVVRLENNVHA